MKQGMMERARLFVGQLYDREKADRESKQFRACCFDPGRVIKTSTKSVPPERKKG